MHLCLKGVNALGSDDILSIPCYVIDIWMKGSYIYMQLNAI